MRTLTRLIPAVLLILPFTPALLHAADDNTALMERLNELSKKVKTLEDNVTANSLRRNQVEAELRDIRVELGKIRELLEHMAQQQGTIRIQPGYNSSSVIPGAAIPTTGTITLQNVFSAPATVRINDQSYFVDANQTRLVRNFPVGPFQYSVDVQGFGMVLPPRRETLPSGGGFRIRIFPAMP